jgi:glutamate--cysteine ligase
MYDASALDAAWDICKSWDLETREQMRIDASVHGLQAETNGIKMIDLASQVLNLSQAGLAARGKTGAGGMIEDETHFLNALQESIDTGKTPADELLDKYHRDWGGDLKRIYPEFSY